MKKKKMFAIVAIALCAFFALSVLTSCQARDTRAADPAQNQETTVSEQSPPQTIQNTPPSTDQPKNKGDLTKPDDSSSANQPENKSNSIDPDDFSPANQPEGRENSSEPSDNVPVGDQSENREAPVKPSGNFSSEAQPKAGENLAESSKKSPSETQPENKEDSLGLSDSAVDKPSSPDSKQRPSGNFTPEGRPSARNNQQSMTCFPKDNGDRPATGNAPGMDDAAPKTNEQSPMSGNGNQGIQSPPQTNKETPSISLN